MSKYGVFSSPYFSAFGLNMEKYGVALRIPSDCGKIPTGKNSVFGHFYAMSFPKNTYGGLLLFLSLFLSLQILGCSFYLFFRLCIELLTEFIKEFSAMFLKDMLSLPWELKLVSESKMTVCISISVFIMASFKATSFCKK